MATVIRLGALALGLTCTGLGCYGAFEFAHRLEGEVTYLVLAAPVIAATAALIPPIAETTWRSGHVLKAILWWLVLLPAGAVVFFSAAERVHTATAGAEAERGALRGAAARAEATLTKAEAELAKARAQANKARGQKQCGPDCRTKLSAEASAQADVEAARQGLLQAQRKATVESPFKAPVWLLPAALDAVAFMAIWTGLSGWSSAVLVKGPVKRPRRRALRRRRRVSEAQAKVTRPVADNDNNVVVPFRAS
jgi:hypothetical protein